MTIVLRDGKDPWTARVYDRDGGVVIEGDFTDVIRGKTFEEELLSLLEPPTAEQDQNSK